MNPRAVYNDLLPFQGSPFSLLGISPGLSVSSGEGGIRTHAPLRTNGFQDRLVMTTSIPLHASIFTNFSVRSANNDYSIRSGFSCQQLFFIFCNFLLVLQKKGFFPDLYASLFLYKCLCCQQVFRCCNLNISVGPYALSQSNSTAMASSVT